MSRHINAESPDIMVQTFTNLKLVSTYFLIKFFRLIYINYSE